MAESKDKLEQEIYLPLFKRAKIILRSFHYLPPDVCQWCGGDGLYDPDQPDSPNNKCEHCQGSPDVNNKEE